MAWHSLWKWFSPWSVKYENIDMIHYYKEYVLKTEEQRKNERIIREKKTKEALQMLKTMYNWRILKWQEKLNQ